MNDLPRFPGELPGASPPEPPDPPADRLRHALPALVMVAGVAFALLVVAAVAAAVVFREVQRGWLVLVLILAVFLALPAVAIGAAYYQRAKMRRERME